ncbi:MAG: insulinase family protein [Thermoanaerobaculia bacterium]|nr:insulinase family protein [Thermoanaerobaculia bacterium]
MQSSTRASLARLLAQAVLSLLLLGSLACTSIDHAGYDPAATPPPPTTPQAEAEPAATQPAAPQPAAPQPAAQEVVETGEFDFSNAPLKAAIPVAPEVRTGVLDNGLRFFIRKNEKPENRAELRLAINAGSILEDDDQLGLAHFLEHMAFNGTKNFEKLELIDYLQTIGMRFGADVNAYTSFDETVYMLTIPTDDEAIVDKAFLILADWAGHVALDPEEIEAERGVVVEEWRLSRGAGMRLFDKQLPILFHGSLYPDRLPIGTKESVETSPREAVARFYEDWYRPDLMAVIAVGDFDVDQVEARIREAMAPLTGPAEPRTREVFDIPGHEETLVSLETDKELTATRVTVAFKHPAEPEGTVNAYRRGLIEGLHTSMFNSRLGEIAQKPNPPFIVAGSSVQSLGRTDFTYSLDALAGDGQTESALEALLLEAERVDRHGFTQSELERAKTNLLRGYQQLFQERDKAPSGAFAAEYVRHFLQGETVPGIEGEVALAERFVPGITLDEVNSLGSRWITEENRVILVSAPEKEDVELPEEEAVLAIFQEVDQRQVDAWVDETVDRPLLTETPTPGQVTDSESFAELGVTEWTLSNGVRVVLKPTDFQNDEILFRGNSPGGTSLVPLEDLASARFATAILGQSGVGEFGAVELGKALAGKVAQAAPSIGELEEGISGSAAPDDLETALQLAYLHFTAPRLDPEAAGNFIQRYSAIVANRNQRPETLYVDEFQKRFTLDHPRRQAVTVETLQSVEPSKSLDIYRNRFADASDFTFFFVGNFDLEAIRPLVETYLGGLPSSEREETWKDPVVDRPGGVVTFEVEAGIEPKSRVRLVFHGEKEWSREESFLVSNLARVLEIRMIELLREKLGLTYGVGIGGGLSWRPDPEYTFSFSFGCNPDEVDRIVGAMLDELKRMADEGVDPELVDKVKANLQREREVQLKENSFWLGILEAYWTRDTDPNLILAYDDLVGLLTPESMQATLRTYLDFDRYILGVMVPDPEAVASSAETSRR